MGGMFRELSDFKPLRVELLDSKTELLFDFVDSLLIERTDVVFNEKSFFEERTVVLRENSFEFVRPALFVHFIDQASF